MDKFKLIETKNGRILKIIENESVLNKLSEGTITKLMNVSKRLQKYNLRITFTMSLSDKSLKRILEYEGSEKSFQALKSNIRLLYRLYKKENLKWIK